MATETESQPPKKQRKKLRRLLVAGIVLFVIGLAINGPVSRWLILSTLDKQLQNQGMQGNAQISGTLMSGFSFTGVSYAGSQGIQSININRLVVDYRLLELFDSRLRMISVDNGTIVIDTAEFQKTPDPSSDADQPFTETLQKIQPWISHPAIDIRQLDVTIMKQGEQQAHISLAALAHQADSTGFSLRGLQVTDRTGKSTPVQNVHIVWLDKSLTLDRVEVLPDIALEKVNLDWKSDLQAEALVHFLQSRLALKLNDSIDIHLSGGNIDSNELVKRFELDLPGSFVLSKIDAHIKNWQKAPAEWNIEGDLKLGSASYKDHHLTDTSIKITQNDSDYAVNIDGEFNTNEVHIDIGGKWFAPSDKNWWKSTEADFMINTPKLGTLAELWKDRPARLGLSNTSIGLEGTIRFESNRLAILKGVGHFKGLTADNVSLPPFSITTDYRDGSIATATLVSNFNNVDVVNIEARYDPAAETYQASLQINEANPAWINALARVFKVDMAVNGPVQLAWSGLGSATGVDLLKLEHQGDLEIKQLGLQLQENPAVHITTQLSYQWPDHVQLKSLDVKEDEWHAQANMQWDGKRITATSTQLTRNNELIASLNGSLPYHVNIRNAGEFSEQTEPWNLSVVSQPVALAKLHDWFGIDLLNGLTGDTKLDIQISGSPKNPEIKGQAKATEIKGLDDQNLLPLDAVFDFHSKDQRLIFEGTLSEGKNQRLSSSGSIPFKPAIWIRDPDRVGRIISNAPVSADIKMNRLPLTRFKKFIPGIKTITGYATGNARVRGTMEKPIYSIDLDADIPLIRISGSDDGDLRNIKFNAHLDQTHKGSIASATLVSNVNNVDVVNIKARYDPAVTTYQASLQINEANPAWINALARVFKVDLAVNGPVQLTWSGSGSASGADIIKLEHQGDLEIKHLELQLPENPAIQITTQLSYQWPDNVQLKSLDVKEDEWHAQAIMQWDGKSITATSTQLTRNNELIASLSGSLPYHVNIRSVEEFSEQTDPWNLSVVSEPVALAKLRDWFGIDLLNELTGTTKLDIKLSGSPKNPEIKGQAMATELKGLDDQKLLPLDAVFDFYSKDQSLIFEGTVSEGKDQRLTSSGSIPFTPAIWLKDPDWISQFASNAPISAEIKMDRMPLTRFKKFIPGLKSITGSASGNARISGTIEKPVYSLDLDADIPLIQITKSDVGDIRNIKINTRIDQTQKAVTNITAEMHGGKFEVTGEVDLNDTSKPTFDIAIKTRYALIHRNDLLSVRANSDLRVMGSIDDATISGTIGTVESVFYKDLELIPIGVPSSAVATVKLPRLNPAKAADALPVPAPFSDWKLDLVLRTDDPILIRGNVATGSLKGSLKVGGTLSKPQPEGTIIANRVKARLPFSILNIERGQIIYNGRDGLNPSLKITGKSTVGAYDVNMFVYGPASSPKTTFSSFPPLPESEVMSLLATGTTTSNLENHSVATFKAFQIFLLKLKQRNDRPGGNKLFKSMLTGVEDLNLNVGEVDPFTGRKFASGTVEVLPRWHLTAQVDDTQHTRGLIIYVLRFR